ncbi:dehydrogenase reductase SDR family member 2 [Colletotrichum tofieldiae]|uniref:Dehydrogenase reductase SDR family member 2 n=1 Tax=Colletotrichum tofieldiae TaxID=708197 RepID=A0A166PBB8_9PEZI|nr:dehydrogenase reductase SDR family member 2 [Colletotrichum tofieldiae]
MVNQDLQRLIAIPAVVSKVHKKPYPAISPFRHELNQATKTILITGAAEGVGFFIARAFAQASASRIIILDIRPDALAAAAAKLKEEVNEISPKTIIDARVCDVGNLHETDTLWSNLFTEGITVDVLVLSAACYGPGEPILNSGRDKIWSSFITNVRALLDHTERFYKQENHKKQKGLLQIRMLQRRIYVWDAEGARPSYGLTKNSGALLIQQIAKDAKPEIMQIINFHPGEVFTESAKRQGFSEDMIEWYDGNLGGQFALWAATGEAEFLHGRFIWAAWDVNELQSEEFQKLLQGTNYLKIGVKGL